MDLKTVKVGGITYTIKDYTKVNNMANRVYLDKTQFSHHAYKPSVTNIGAFKRMKARNKKQQLRVVTVYDNAPDIAKVVSKALADRSKELESRIQNALMFDDHDDSIF